MPFVRLNSSSWQDLACWDGFRGFNPLLSKELSECFNQLVRASCKFVTPALEISSIATPSISTLVHSLTADIAWSADHCWAVRRWMITGWQGLKWRCLGDESRLKSHATANPRWLVHAKGHMLHPSWLLSIFKGRPQRVCPALLWDFSARTGSYQSWFEWR